MAMHHMKLKSAVAKHLEEFKADGEQSVRLTLESNDFSPEEVDEIIDALKNGGKASEEKSDKEESEIEQLKKQLAEMQKKLDQKSQAPSPNIVKIKRPKVDEKRGLKLYDLYKVQKEIENEYNDEGDVIKSKFTGNFLKVGRPVKTNIKVQEYRAKIFNDQSINHGERLYLVEEN